MNACTAVGEKLKYENLDLYLQVIRSMHGARGHKLKLWKADIDSAFRRALDLGAVPANCEFSAQAHTAAARASPVCPHCFPTAWAGLCRKTFGLHVRSGEQCPPLGASWYIPACKTLRYLQIVRCTSGQLLKTLARRIFYMPVCRFVDDFFSVEDEEVANHSMEVFAE